MDRSNRLFEIIQLLRSATAPVTAQAIATTLEVTKRTIYRDIVALQARRVPIAGEAGIGYVMQAGFDLPPLMFTTEEVEAIAVGLALLGRTNDRGLQNAARRVAQKIGSVLPSAAGSVDGSSLRVSSWHAIPNPAIGIETMRAAIRDERKIDLHYLDGAAQVTERTVCPVALVYYVDSVVLAAWCELRAGFRHFRADRIRSWQPGGFFTGDGARLRALWSAQHELFPQGGNDAA